MFLGVFIIVIIISLINVRIKTGICAGIKINCACFTCSLEALFAKGPSPVNYSTAVCLPALFLIYRSFLISVISYLRITVIAYFTRLHKN
jgi:hypothetical protein